MPTSTSIWFWVDSGTIFAPEIGSKSIPKRCRKGFEWGQRFGAQKREVEVRCPPQTGGFWGFCGEGNREGAYSCPHTPDDLVPRTRGRRISLSPSPSFSIAPSATQTPKSRRYNPSTKKKESPKHTKDPEPPVSQPQVKGLWGLGFLGFWFFLLGGSPAFYFSL